MMIDPGGHPMSGDRIKRDTYDRGIMPAETAARIEREQEGYKQAPTDADDSNTTDGYTVDNEGLVNNFAIEPEMYYEEPGDRRRQQEQAKAQRAQELAEVNETQETGRLTEEFDNRGKGTGVI
jgi:hypothetical protein